MIGIMGIVVVAGVIAFLEMPPLLQKGLKKERRIFLTLLLTGTGLSIAMALGVKLPNPLDLLVIVYKPLSDLLMTFLK